MNARLPLTGLILWAASGCVVQSSTPMTGSLRAAWTIQGEAPLSACAKYGIQNVTVSVVDASQTKVLGSATTGCTAGQLRVDGLPSATGTYVQVDGYAATDAAGKPSWGNSPLTGTFVIQGGVTTQVQTAINLVPFNAPTGGSLVTAWTVQGEQAATGCAKRGITKVTVSVLDASQTKVLGSTSGPCGNGQIKVDGLPAATGTFVQVDGYTASDAAGKPSFGNAPLTGSFTIQPGMTTQVSAPIDMIPLIGGNPRTGFGNVYVDWTVAGEAAATACTKYGIVQVTARVLDAKRAELGSLTVPCNSGNATLANIPAGTGRWLQIDAVGPKLPDSWGNINLDGPFTISNGQVSMPPKPLDMGKRSVLSLDWAFANGSSCQSSGVSTVFVEIRNAANQVVVPTSDPWAAKPCDLSVASGYDARVIDYANLEPRCAIPPGAKSLVLCNVNTATVGVTLAGTGPKSAMPLVGGSMQIAQFQPGSQTNVLEPIVLAPCGAGNPCIQP